MTETQAGADDGDTGVSGPRGIGGGAATSGGTAGIEWPKKAADTVEIIVDTIHDKAIRPASLAARAVVFGLVVAAVATVLAVMVAIAVIRVLDNYAFGTQVWASYSVVGGAFTLVGLALWSRRSVRPRAAGR